MEGLEQETKQNDRPLGRRVVENLSSTARMLLETIDLITSASPSADLARSFLLTGPPGVGKTFAVRTTVERAQQSVNLVVLRGSEIFGAGLHPAESAKLLRRHFISASQTGLVSLIFLDECEALFSSELIAAVLAHLLDQVAMRWRTEVVVAATNRIDAVPAWLRRPGRFDHEIPFMPPNASERETILRSLLLQQQQSVPESLRDVAEACVGYVPADLSALVRRASLLALQQEATMVTYEILQEAMSAVGASVCVWRVRSHANLRTHRIPGPSGCFVSCSSESYMGRYRRGRWWGQGTSEDRYQSIGHAIFLIFKDCIATRRGVAEDQEEGVQSPWLVTTAR